MKYLKHVASLLFLFLLAAGVVSAQTPTVSPFSTSFTAIALPGNASTVAGSLSGADLGISQNCTARETNLIAPTTLTGFYGGGKCIIPAFSTFVQNHSPQLNGYNWQLAISANAGIVRVTRPDGSIGQHFSAILGPQLSYAVKGSSTYSLVVEVDAMRLPEYAKGWKAGVSCGPLLTFGKPATTSAVAAKLSAENLLPRF